MKVLGRLRESLAKDSTLLGAGYKLSDWAGLYQTNFPERQVMGIELDNVKVPELISGHETDLDQKLGKITVPFINPGLHRGHRHRLEENFSVMLEDFDLVDIWPALLASLEGKVVVKASAEFESLIKESRRCRRMRESYIIRHSCEGKGSDFAGYSDYLDMSHKEIAKQKLMTMNVAEYLMTFLFFIKIRKFFMPSACNASVGFPSNLVQKSNLVQVPVITFNEGELLKNLHDQVYSRANVSIVNPLRLLDPKKMSERFLPSLICELVSFDDKKPLPFKVIEVLAVKPK